uniref:Carboxylic ester hydrolase n=1 Tax=Bionectria ochroleuca TaxID=29856 RepID=A0A8H7NE40_BIOOC
MQAISSPTIAVNGCLIIGARFSPAASAACPKPVEAFYNIPYASTDRFSKARPLPLGSQTSGTRLDASRIKFAGPNPNCTTSTLRLHITRPSTASQQPLPVVIYFHGGAFNFGDPLETDLVSFVAHAQKDIIVVAAHYRLGVLGFLAGEGEANLGLKDQRLAVEWVHSWIPVFGGDPALITLRGVSAGAHSIGHHMLNPSPLPFHKAILESGSPTARSVLSASHPRTVANLDSVRSSMLPVVTPPRTVKVNFLLDAGLDVFSKHTDSLIWPFQPVVEGPGGIIPDLPLNLWQQKASSDQSTTSGSGTSPLPAAVITGFCTSEGIDFIPKSCSDFRSFFTKLIPSLTPTDLEALEALYPPRGDQAAGRRADLARRLGVAYGDYAYICPVIHTAHMASRLGGTVYLYEFAALVSEAHRAASHASHSDFVTRSTLGAGCPGLEAVSAEMHSRWAEFAASPTGVFAEDRWPPFVTPFGGDDDGDEAKGKLLVFGQGNNEVSGGGNAGVPVQTRTLTKREKEVCKFWWDRMELSQGDGNAGVVSEAY